jgi:hypothetical protein
MRNQHDQLIAAIKNDNAMQVAALLKENPSLVNFQDPIRVSVNRNGSVAQKNFSSVTPLTFAIQNARWNSANALLAHGADPRLEGIDLGYRNVAHPVFSQDIVKVSAIQAFEGVQSRVVPSFAESFMKALQTRIIEMSEHDERTNAEETEQAHRYKLSLKNAKEERVEARFQEIVEKLRFNQQPYASPAAAAAETVAPVSVVSTASITAVLNKLSEKLQSLDGKTDDKSTDKIAVLTAVRTMMEAFEQLPSIGAPQDKIKDFAKKIQAIKIACEKHPLWDEALRTSEIKTLVNQAQAMAFQSKLTPEQELSAVRAVERPSALTSALVRMSRFFDRSSAAAASASTDEEPVVGTVVKKL